MSYSFRDDRYDKMQYRRTGKSGLLLPAVSLGLWHNFGDIDNQEPAREISAAFDMGITHLTWQIIMARIGGRKFRKNF
jgi:L-glyceraldehyde 3-phosphate reductase